ncbi:MAG: RluA family pseudouridine synthase [Candidatus Acidiferrales bacterium]
MKSRRQRATAHESPDKPAAPPPAQTHARAFIVSADDAGRRLDVYLAAQLPELSRTRIQELIREARVRVGHRAARASHRIEVGEQIEIEILERPALTVQAEDLPLDVLYQDDDLVVVNKAAGMVVHAGAGHPRGTLVNALLHRLSALPGGTLRPGIVHRLDRGTSGVLVVARTDAAHRRLADQFRTRAVRKTYLALLEGVLKPESGSIQLPISRDKRRRVRMTASAGTGRQARTDWRVLWRGTRFTLVEIELHTGRTHQIRAHFAALGRPVVGDTLYGAALRPRAGNRELDPLGRPFLHAARIGFEHPATGERVEFRAPVPAELRNYIARIATSEPAGADTAVAIDAALAAFL